MIHDPELERLLEAKNAAGQRYALTAEAWAEIAYLGYDAAEDAYGTYKTFSEYKEYKEKLT
jgi:hypothetical protein